MYLNFFNGKRTDRSDAASKRALENLEFLAFMRITTLEKPNSFLSIEYLP